MKYTRKFKYWHSILNASKTEKAKLTKNGSKLKDLMMDLPYPRKPEGRVLFTNLKNGKETWIDVKYIGRLPANASKDEIITLGKKVDH